MEQKVNIKGLERKPIFDAVRVLLGRGFRQDEVARLDAAIDRALVPELEGATGANGPRLGALSERFESAGRGPGAVSNGSGDPGGVSYGIYQLASRAGTVLRFLQTEGAAWGSDFAGSQPGSPAFSTIWRAIAQREPEAFASAQHLFIKRSHYEPAVAKVLAQTGLDLDTRHPAIRDATWSVAVQHGGAARILITAILRTDTYVDRLDSRYDRHLIEAIYQERTAYVLRVAARSAPGARAVLESITRNRYPAERAAAVAMFDLQALT